LTDPEHSVLTGSSVEFDIMRFALHKINFGIDIIFGCYSVLFRPTFSHMIQKQLEQRTSPLSPAALRNDDDVVSILAKKEGFKIFYIHLAPVFLTPSDALSSDGLKRAIDRHTTHAELNPTYSDNLMIYLIVSLSLMVVFFILFLVFLVEYLKTRKKMEYCECSRGEKINALFFE